MLTNMLFARIQPTLIRRAVVFNFAVLSSYRFKEYYVQKMGEYDAVVQGIVKEMGEERFNKGLVVNRIEKYLEHQSKRTSKGLLGLLCAVRESRDSALQRYGRHIIEYFLRDEDPGKYVCDKYELTALLQELNLKRSQSHEKIKEALVKYRTAEVIMLNADRITPSHFYEILSLLTSNDRLSVTINNRFINLAKMFNQKLLAFFADHLANRLPEKQAQLITLSFVGSVLHYMHDFPLVESEDALVLFQFIDKLLSSNDKSIRKIQVFNAYRYFPYSTRNKEGLYIKDLVLKKVLLKEKNIRDKGEDWNEVLFCYSVLGFEFYKVMNGLQFRYEDELNYLLRQDVQVPLLPEFFWQRYKARPQLVNKDHIARSIIKKVYPERYLSTSSQQSSTIRPPKITENEVKVRLELALQHLGLRAQREVEVSGRYVDFLVDDIIIECDGDHHFDLHVMDYNETTHFRNLHLLLSGYRLLIVNIFEYNRHRRTEQFAGLLRKKLMAMDRNRAVMVV